MLRAMDLLARREHSQFELARKLRMKGFAEDDIPGTLASLMKSGLLSDQRFAEQYCRARTRRGFGPRRIEQALRERGVSEELIALTLGDISNQDWKELAQCTWVKKFAGKKPEDYLSWAKQKRFLQYRGFEDEHSEWLSYENS